MSAYSEKQLVLKALGDSHPAFEQLVKQYQHRVLRTIASIISDEHAAQDVAQETFLSAWSNLAKLKEQHKFGGWLNKIAISFAKRWLRDQRKHRENTFSFEDNAVSLAQEASYHSEKLRQDVWDAIDELSEDHREVVTLHYISGYSYKEIGAILSVPASTVHGRLQQAKKQLRKEFLDMVTKLQLEIDSTVHKFLKEHAKQDGVSVENLVIRLIERYIRNIDKPEVTVRQVWEPSREPVLSDFCGAPSPDGRYLSFTNWTHGNLAIRDLTTGQYRDLTDEGSWDMPGYWADYSRWSPNGKQIAYGWRSYQKPMELRIVGLDGSQPRVLYRSENIQAYIHVHAWSQDGKSIMVDLKKPDNASEIALISVVDGSVRVLKSLKNLSFWNWMSLAPDGSYVAYARSVEEHEGTRDIFLVTTDGSGEETPLVKHPADDYGPVWTPDGKSIVFVSDRSGNYDSWLIQVVDGKPAGKPQLIKRDTGQMKPMGFTRKGSLYYGLGTDSTDVYIASIDSTKGELLSPPTKAIRQFEGRNLSPAWSPDGKSLAYVSLRNSPRISGHKNVQCSGSLVIHSMETGEEREIIIKSPAMAMYPSWSPDGGYILCAADPRGFDDPSKRSPGHFSLVDVQTGNVAFIMERDLDRRFFYWQWSPDGKSIFYTSKKKGLPSNIMVYDRETDKEKEIYQDAGSSGFAVSPDGRQLALAGNGGRALKVMQIDGGEDRELLRLQDHKGYDVPNCFAWTADGRYVLFKLGTKLDKRGLSELWRIPAEGGEPQKLLAMEGLRDISVHPDGQRIAFTGGGYHTMEVWAMENFLPGFAADK